LFWILIRLLQSQDFIRLVWTSGLFSFTQRIGLTSQTLLQVFSHFSLASLVLTIIIIIMTGINISLLFYYVKKSARLRRSTGMSLLGVIVGILGVGCSSCGSVLLTSVIGLSATSSILGILPFKGLEINILAIVLLGVSIVMIAKKISNPLLCKIKS